MSPLPGPLQHPALVVWLLTLATVASAQQSAAPQGRRVTVVFTDRLTVLAPNGLRSVSTRVALPQSSEEQTILSLEISPEPGAIAEEAVGREIASWEPEDGMEFGDQMVARWVCDAVLHPRRSGLPADQVGTLSQVPQAIADEYLIDSSLYALQSDAVRRASAAAVTTPRSIADLLSQLMAFVASTLEYEADGKWDSADIVLARRSGSASEYAIATIALCRLWGVPARYAGGVRCVTGAGFYVDRTWHRWVEAYIPGLGWRGLDPTRATRLGVGPATLGGTPDDILTVSVGDGAPGSLLGHHYLSWHTWAGPEDAARVTRRAWSFGDVPDAVRRRTADLAAQIGSAVTPVQRVAALQLALEIDHPFVLPWLEDLLYHPTARVQATRTMAQIGGTGAVLPLIDSLGHADDAEGDAAVAQVLAGVTGGDLGPDPAAWEAWLSTDAGRAATRGGETRP